MSYAQGRRDLVGKNNYAFNNSGDTTGIRDSLGLRDTINVFKGDSTARLQYFVYSEPYDYTAGIKEPKSPILPLDASQIVTEIKFDSSGNVSITRSLDGYPLNVPLVMPLEKFISKYSEYSERRDMAQFLDDKYKGNVTDDLSKLFEKFTNITIPLPFKSETIFGPSIVRLQISGTVDVTASFQSITSDQVYLSTLNSDQKNINFKQDLQITAKGTIGDKLTIDADWNTQRTFDFENQLKIKYTGYPDEVIQKIEAGNVSLETKSSLIPSTQALFGVRGEFKLGPLTLATVFSQKKSKTETKDYTAGVALSDFALTIDQYSDNNYFVDESYKPRFLDVFNNTSGTVSSETINNQILSNEFEVWVSCEPSVSEKRTATAVINIPLYDTAAYNRLIDTVVTSNSTVYKGYFRKLTANDYYVNYQAGFIALRLTVDNMVVGVSYKKQNGEKYGYTTTDRPGNDQKLLIKMVKSQSIDPVNSPESWSLKMKNIYRLPVSNVIEDGFNLNIYYKDDNNNLQPSIQANGAQKNIIEIVGLDRYKNPDKTPPPDGIFDYFPGLTIIPATGDIIFPTLKPFDDAFTQAGVDPALIFKDLYLKNKAEISSQNLSSRFVIKGSAKGQAGISNTINLGFNIVQGSVKVYNGQTALTENVDYSVDYSTGTVVIRNATALYSNNLKVSYETNDLFTLASKTFLGARADYTVNDKTSFGFTFVNLRQETLNDKVRVGEEPTNNSMFGLDMTTQVKPGFLTKMVNLLPGYNTKEESTVDLHGEVALITPDPNTKKSVIPQDNGEAVAYIDDMEGAKKILSIGNTFASWTISSVPIDNTLGMTQEESQLRRAKMIWYNVTSDVEVKKVYPLRDVQAGQDRLTPMYVKLDPLKRGAYNYHIKTFDSLKVVEPAKGWNGIMKYLNTTSTDLLNENFNYIEFVMRVDNNNGAVPLTNAKLYIDIGKISEDAIPNHKFDTEDKNENGVLEENEDVGLDGLSVDQKRAVVDSINGTGFTSQNPEYYDDPSGDKNLNTNTGGQPNFETINGTWGNRYIEGGNRPDTEDLNHNGTEDELNQYFEYEVPLDTTNNLLISGRGEPGSGWFQYRIPLSEFQRAFNSPTLTDIQYIRIWMKGVTGAVTLAFIDFNFTGNQWIKADKSDTTYNVSVVSIEENSQIYMSPVPGDALRQNVQNQNGSTTKSNEQSLSIQVNNLINGQKKTAIKDYKSQTLDIFNYKIMKLFVNGDPTFNYTSQYIYDATMIVRFGSDSNNYYEYRAPIHPDVRPGSPWNKQNEVTITFSDLTSLKVSRDSSNQVIDKEVPNGPPGAIYRIKGNPSLSAIRIFELGVEKNKSGPNSVLSGSVWFNELRVIKVDDQNGYAFNVNSSVKIADLATVSVNVSKVDPNFHTIDTRVGSRNTGINWDFATTVNVHKIINNIFASLFSEEWKDFINLPISFRHSEGLVKPKYYPGSDIDIDAAVLEKYNQVLKKTGDENLARSTAEEIRTQSQSLTTRNEFSINGFGFKVPGNNYIIKNFVNAFVVNFSGMNQESRDFTYKYKSEFNYSGNITYNTDFGISQKLNLKINNLINLGDDYKEAKIYLFIPIIPLVPLFSDKFNATADFTRSHLEQRQRISLIDDPISRNFRANRGFGFNWKFIENWIVDMTGTYGVRIGSDMSGFETTKDSLATQKTGSEILKQIFFDNSFINFGKDLDYTQTSTFSPKFNLPVVKKYLDLTASYNVTYGWTNPNTTTNIGYNVGYSNNVTAGINFKIGDVIKSISSGSSEKFRLFAQSMKDGKGKKIFDEPSFNIFAVLKTFIPEVVSLSFQQQNSIANGAVAGRPGFTNFWFPFLKKDSYGPSQWYQLGFTRDPGFRVPGIYVNDQYNEQNSLTITTQMSPIFPNNIKLNLTFKKSTGFNNGNAFTVAPDGYSQLNNLLTSTTTNSYSIFLIGKAEKFSYTPSSNSDENIQNIKSAFEEKIGAIPFPNWTITISGLEKFPLFSEFATNVTLENSFTSEYSEGMSRDTRGLMIPSSLRAQQAFNPLIGLNITFKEIFGGNLTGTIRYNSSLQNTLTPTSSLLQSLSTSDWSVNMNFSKSGFEIPLFGLSLKNDIAFALAISKNLNEPIDYRFESGSETPTPIPGNGSSVTTVNPSIQYSISSKVQMQVFYKYIKTAPTGGTAATIPRTSSEAGLNVRITIN
jgi:cell surface protein SprA